MSQSWKKLLGIVCKNVLMCLLGNSITRTKNLGIKKASAEFQQKSLLNHTFLKYQSCLSYLFYMNILFITMIAFLFCRKFR